MRKNHNIGIAYVLSFINELYFPVAIWIFYYLKFLSFTEIAIVLAVNTLVSIILEVPTGAFADIFGRRTALICAFVVYAFANLALAFATAFWMFVISETLRGLATALYSGSFEALTYDTLKEQKRESFYDKLVANIQSIEWTALFLSALIGGVMFKVFPQLPFILQFVLYIGGTIIALFLIEPKIDTFKYSFKLFITQNVKGFHELFRNVKIARVSLILITISIGFFIPARILGIAQIKEYGFESVGVGVILAAGYLFSAFASQTYPILRSYLGVKVLTVVTSGLLFISLLVANSVGAFVGVLLILGRIASSSVFYNLRSSIINKVLSSENRATALSTMALLFKLPYALFAAAIGAYIDKTSPNAFAYVLGVILVTLLIIQIGMWKVIRVKI